MGEKKALETSKLQENLQCFHLLKQLNQPQVTVTLENSLVFSGASELVCYEHLEEKNTSELLKRKLMIHSKLFTGEIERIL